MPTIPAHIVVRDAALAADWHAQALCAEIGARIRVPDGRHLQVELRPRHGVPDGYYAILDRRTVLVNGQRICLAPCLVERPHQ